MLKKSLIILSIFCLIIFTSNFVFAANMVDGTKNMLNDAGNGIQAMVDGATNAARDAKDGVTNMMDDIGDGIERGTDEVERDTAGMTNGMTNNNGYTATRTSATNNGTFGTNTTLVWVILAVAAVAIIALVWYYATQTDDKYNH